jgi:hypothetical protein
MRTARKNKMRQPKRVIKAGKYLLVFTSFVFLFQLNSFVYPQSSSKPLSVCDLLQNKKKFKGKKVVVESFLQITAETWKFRFEESCPIVESIAIGAHDSFRPDSKFESETNLLSLQNKAEEKHGLPRFSLRWGSLIKVKIRVEGILRTSNKPKYGHLGSYKNLFLITNVEQIGQAQLISVQDMFKDKPEIIATNEE